MVSELPRWMEEVERQAEQCSLIILSGNVRDRVFCPVSVGGDGGAVWGTVSLTDALFILFGTRIGGYDIVGHYDYVDGLVFQDEYETRGATALMAEAFGKIKEPWRPEKTSRRPCVPQGGAASGWIIEAADRIREALSNTEYSAALALDYGTQLISGPDRLDPDARGAFTRLLKAAQEGRRAGSGETKRRNVLVLICDKVNDLPAWLYFNNPYAAIVEIDRPDLGSRKRLLGTLLARDPEDDFVKEAAGETDGLTVRDLEGVALLGRAVGEDERAKTVVERYKYGTHASLWGDLDWGQLADIEEELKKSVFGQETAARHVADVVKRARLHLSGAQHGSGKPRGVLFFAGPTGVGKTEMAKAVAKIVFGSKDAYCRFDMSEYAREHSDQRLLGAPPGYVGYDAGGQLTNAVKENPFRVLLFDEIDKADGSILDKFLQILEDGRMTDGRGETVYFSEAIIIFTSNAGIYRTLPDGTKECLVDPDELHTYEQVRERVLQGIRRYFLEELGRPELLNRFGNNIVVFNFLRADVLERILRELVLPKVGKRLMEIWGVTAVIEEDAIQRIASTGGVDVANGGRGIGNHVEDMLVNPLARVIFDEISRLREAKATAAGDGGSVRFSDEDAKRELGGRAIRVKDIVLPRAAEGAEGGDERAPRSFELDFEWVERPNER